MEFPIRINKYLANSGYATRRSADRLIEEGRVFVNGKMSELGQKIEENDVVEIKDYDTTKFRYLLYYKPRDVVTLSSADSEIGIAERIKHDHSIEGLFPIGRLDKDIEGLIVLTDDGRLTSKLLEVPINQEYEIMVDKNVTPSIISHINRGVKIESHIARTAHGAILKGTTTGLVISLQENKKYNVRSICATLGLKIISLKRTKILDLELKNLKPGAFYELKYKEVKALHKALGLH